MSGIVKILAVEPRDIHVVIDLNIEAIKHLVNFLDNCTVEFDSTKDLELSESVSFVTKQFFKMCDDVLNDLKEGDKNES